MNTLRRLLASESGATLVEYALIVGLLAVAVIAAGQFFGAALYAMYQKIATTLSGV